MNTRSGLSKRLHTGNHCSSHANYGKRIACSGCMTANDIILEGFQVIIIHAILRHRAKTSIDTIDHLIGSEMNEESVTFVDFLQHLFIEFDLFITKQYLLYIRQM